LALTHSPEDPERGLASTLQLENMKTGATTKLLEKQKITILTSKSRETGT
jgi:hypothetical protein